VEVQTGERPYVKDSEETVVGPFRDGVSDEDESFEAFAGAEVENF
jgi:hypothetical protein